MRIRFPAIILSCGLGIIIYAAAGSARASDDVSAWRNQCDAGDLAACGALGDHDVAAAMQLAGTRGTDMPDADVKDLAAEGQQLLRRACDGGQRESCVSLGELYDSIQNLPFPLGAMIGIPADDAEAIRLYRLACDADVMRGCYLLSYAYEYGVGVAHDSEMADRLTRRACGHGYEPACKLLCLNEDAFGCRALCERGNAYACEHSQ